MKLPIYLHKTDERGISIIIPTYNRELFVKEAIESVLQQDYEGTLEIIISDDGSSDNTLEVAKTFENNVKIIAKQKDCIAQGVAGARNRGIKASTQPYICFLDSDDFYLPHHLKRMMAVFEKEPGLGFAFCRVLELKEENGIKFFRPWTRSRILKNDIENPVVSRSKIVHTNSFMFRREVFVTAGYFNESYSNGEDGDEWMRISEKFKGKFANHFGAVYRTNYEIGQLTKNPPAQIKKSSLAIFEEARNRYYNLIVNDQKRIYKIEYNLLRLRNDNNSEKKLRYYLKCLLIIIRYPLGYLQKLLENYYTWKEKKEKKDWDSLNKYIGYS